MIELRELGNLEVGDLIQNCGEAEELFLVIKINSKKIAGWLCSVVSICENQTSPVLDEVWIYKSDLLVSRCGSQ